jgi:DNA-binding sugar fermentation-stimulating protein
VSLYDIPSNISKIQLHNLSRFGTTEKECKIEFEFSFKIQETKVWSCFVEVVGLAERKAEKFGLHFSDLCTSFYDFSKALDLVVRKLR